MNTCMKVLPLRFTSSLPYISTLHALISSAGKTMACNLAFSLYAGQKDTFNNYSNISKICERSNIATSVKYICQNFRIIFCIICASFEFIPYNNTATIKCCYVRFTMSLYQYAILLQQFYYIGKIWSICSAALTKSRVNYPSTISFISSICSSKLASRSKYTPRSIWLPLYLHNCRAQSSCYNRTGAKSAAIYLHVIKYV